MVSCMRYGGLGNQMFQVAACIATALKHNEPYHIPKHTLDDRKWKPYQFDNVIYSDDEDGVITAQVYKEKSFTYSKIPKPQGRFFILDGYFQSEKYFAGYRKEILRAFGFESAGTKNRIVSIHVRRGDYLDLPTKHPTVTMEYISAAIDYFEELGYFSFYVFSDDMDWCKKNINEGRFKYSVFLYSNQKSPMNDLIVGSSCEHNIGSNSTFSWWMHYLNNNPDKIGVFPKIWFGPDLPHNTKDLYPENAIIL